MSINEILLYLVPKDRKYVPLFMQSVENLVATTEKLKQLFDQKEPAGQKACIDQIRELEKKGDGFANDVFTELNQTFITPFDREDIHKLAVMIDEVINNINRAAKKLDLYKVTNFPPEFNRFAEILHQSAIEMKNAIRFLGKLKDYKRMSEATSQIKQLENDADEVYHQSITRLFEEETNPIIIIKLRDIFMYLERAADRTKAVAKILEAIIVKMA